MLETSQILEILQPYIAALKEQKSTLSNAEILSKKNEKGRDKETAPPKFSSFYYKTNSLLEDMLVHYDEDKVPYKLFNSNAPHEDEKQRKYRIENYEPLTVPYMHKAVGILKRVCNRSNVNIDYINDTQRDYYTDIPTFGTVFNYFDQIVLQQKAIDPNGVLGVHIPQYPLNINDDGSVSIDPTERVSPLPVVYSSKEVVDFVEDHYLIIWSKEKVKVKVTENKYQKIGNIFEVWDTDSFYKIVQVGNYTDFKFEVYHIYSHNLGYLPAQKLKGSPYFYDNKVIYKSYYYPAVPNLNRALYLFSNLDISYVTQMYPQKYRFVSQCTNPECDNGRVRVADIYNGDNDVLYETCKTCNGSGTHQGPMGEYQITIPSTNNAYDNDNIASLPTPPFGYIAPPSDPLNSVKERAEYLIRMAFANINIDITDKPNGQTATEKRIDKDELLNFITGFSREFYALLKFTYDTIGEMRWGDSYKEVIVNEPRIFDIRTADDLMAELKEIGDIDLPPSIRATLVKDLIKKMFADNETIIKSLPLMEFVDGLLGLSNEQIRTDVAAGRTEPYEKLIHDRFIYLVTQSVSENPAFLEQPIETQAEKIKELAKSLVLTEQNLVDQIINGTAA